MVDSLQSSNKTSLVLGVASVVLFLHVHNWTSQSTMRLRQIICPCALFKVCIPDTGQGSTICSYFFILIVPFETLLFLLIASFHTQFKLIQNSTLKKLDTKKFSKDVTRIRFCTQLSAKLKACCENSEKLLNKKRNFESQC